jgi:hypothetical protein
MGQARRRVALVIGSGQQKFRNIALDDLVYYLVGVLNDPRAYGKCYDVGCDDILTSDQMIDVAAEVLGRNYPVKIHLPRVLLTALAPLIERLSKVPKGALKGLLDGMKTDLVGDPMPIRTILPRPPLVIGAVTVRAVQKATSTTPIVFSVVVEPVGDGLATNLQRPGGNATGVTTFDPHQAVAQVDLL